jgi:SNF2 family DNA or RNA helicase
VAFDVSLRGDSQLLGSWGFKSLFQSAELQDNAGNPPDDFPVIVTSFEIAIRERKALSKLSYKYLVVDEGHRLKNSNCLLVQELKKISADNKLLLTGTPSLQRSCRLAAYLLAACWL